LHTCAIFQAKYVDNQYQSVQEYFLPGVQLLTQGRTIAACSAIIAGAALRNMDIYNAYQNTVGAEPRACTAQCAPKKSPQKSGRVNTTRMWKNTSKLKGCIPYLCAP
jgi:hypothetical protein